MNIKNILIILIFGLSALTYGAEYEGILRNQKKLFLSYSHSQDQNTTNMVDELQQILAVRNMHYYRDTQNREKYGINVGESIEYFMENVKRSDILVIFLNEPYLRSRNCMYELLQGWNSIISNFSPKVFFIRHPDCNNIFGQEACNFYGRHWRGIRKNILDDTSKQDVNMKWIRKEILLVNKIIRTIPSIIEYFNKHLMGDYNQRRQQDFDRICNLLGDERDMGSISALNSRSSINNKKIESYFYWKGIEGKQENNEEAARLYKEAAEAGDIEAQKSIAYLYWMGKGVPENNAQSAKWYHEAAEAGDIEAQKSIAYLYWMGKGVLEDNESAASWYLCAAIEGDTEAQKSLSFLYQKGKGVPQNKSQAKYWSNLHSGIMIESFPGIKNVIRNNI